MRAPVRCVMDRATPFKLAAAHALTGPCIPSNISVASFQAATLPSSGVEAPRRGISHATGHRALGRCDPARPLPPPASNNTQRTSGVMGA